MGMGGSVVRARGRRTGKENKSASERKEEEQTAVYRICFELAVRSNTTLTWQTEN